MPLRFEGCRGGIEPSSRSSRETPASSLDARSERGPRQEITLNPYVVALTYAVVGTGVIGTEIMSDLTLPQRLGRRMDHLWFGYPFR